MSDLVNVAGGIAHHRAAVAVRRVKRWLDTDGAVLQRLFVRCVDVLDVDIEECGERFTLEGRADHDDRVPDLYLGGPSFLYLAGDGKHCT